MKITRREFLPVLAGVVTSFCFPGYKKRRASLQETDKPKSLEEKLKTELENEKPLINALRWIDPNLSELIVNVLYCFSEPLIFHKINHQKFKKGLGNLTEADLIHNNSERWANAVSTLISYFVTYPGRFPFTVYIAQNSLNSSQDIKRKNRIFSDFMTINHYYGHVFVDRYLTNAFQHELREAYKKILKENPQYEYKPWAIPLNKTIQIIQDIFPTVKDDVKNDFKNGISNFKNLQIDSSATDWLKSRKNQLNMLLIFLSYISSFVDVVPLVTGDQIQAYTANTATGRMIANLPSQSILCKDLLRRLKEKGDIEGYNEEKVISSAALYNAPLYYVINSSIQSFIDSFFNLKQYSDKEVAYSNLRETIGAVTGSIIFMFLQYKFESSFRSHSKISREEEMNPNLLTRFANWYIEPEEE